jgi:uncharacterized membrane protein
MKAATVHRSLWWAFLGWTLLLFILLPFDIGEAQVKLWTSQPAVQNVLLGILKAADAVWLVLAAAFLYFYIIRLEGVNVARRAALTLLIGSGVVLAINLKTGFPLGPLIYTSQLGARISGVPFSIPLLWLVIIVAARYSVLHFWEHAQRWQIAVGTGLLAVLTDLSLEWVAWKVRAYWLWYFPLANTPDWPPLQNFAVWFVLAAALAWFAFPAARPFSRHQKPLIMLGLINLLFWLTLALRLSR